MADQSDRNCRQGKTRKPYKSSQQDISLRGRSAMAPGLSATRCHGRGREFESRRPRHSFQKSCTNFAATNEGAKGHDFAPFLHPLSSIRAVFTSSVFTGLTTLTRVRWSSFQERRPAQGPLLAQRVLLARSPACKPPAWTVTRSAAATPASL